MLCMLLIEQPNYTNIMQCMCSVTEGAALVSGI